MSSTSTFLHRHVSLGRADTVRLVAWSVLEAAPVVLSGWLVSRAVDQGFLQGRPALGIGLLLAYGLLELCRAVAERQIFPVLAELIESMRDRLVRTVVGSAVRSATSHARSHSAQPDSAVVARLTGHVEIVRNLLSALTRLSRPLVVTLLASVIGLATVAPVLLLVVLPALAITAVGYPATWRALDRRRMRAVLAEERVAEVAGQVLGSLRDIVATGGAARAQAEIEAASAADVAARTALSRVAGWRVLLETVGGRLPLVVVVGLAPMLLHHGLSAGQLIGAVTYLAAYLTPAVGMLTGAVSQYSTQLTAACARLDATTPPAVPARPGAWPRHPGLRVDAVRFGYPSQTPGSAHDLLEDVGLSVPDDEHLAFIGSSGAGKSTLGALLAGVETPSAGRVVLGGVPADDAHRAGATVLVPQEAYLLDGTLRENLTYLRPDAPDTELERACTLLGLEELVGRLGGLDAGLDRDALSGGEGQLLVLARAYVSTAVLVVLDEATSLLDPEHEHLVERAFRARPGILVTVAHRLDAARRADRLVLVDDGTVVTGTHEQLLSAVARYRELDAAR